MIPRPLTPLAAAALLMPFLLFAGCGEEKGGEQTGGAGASVDPQVARTTAERGPVKITVEITPKNPRLSDEPILTLTVEAEEGVEVEMPPFGESLGAFLVRDFREPLPEIREGRKILRQTYTLEPTGTGEHFIFPVSLSFVDHRPEGDGEAHTVETEGLKIEVQSALETEAPSLAELKPPAPPLEMPEERPGYLWWVLGACALLLGGSFFLFRHFRKKQAVPLEKKLTPQELAFLEIKKLLEDGLLDQDVKLFYVAITGIVRRYIERTTGIRAPEQTTEEFLHAIQDEAQFNRDDRVRLGEFLEAADLVKFAALRPGKSEIEESFHRAKAFIGLEREEVAA